MELVLDYLEKVRQELGVEQMVIYIYLLMLSLMNYSKDQMKICSLNVQFQLLMQL